MMQSETVQNVVQQVGQTSIDVAQIAHVARQMLVVLKSIHEHVVSLDSTMGALMVAAQEFGGMMIAAQEPEDDDGK